MTATIVLTGKNIEKDGFVDFLAESLGADGDDLQIQPISPSTEVQFESVVARDAAYKKAKEHGGIVAAITDYVTFGCGKGSGRLAFHQLQPGGGWKVNSFSWKGGFGDLDGAALYAKYLESAESFGFSRCPTMFVMYAGCWHQNEEDFNVKKGAEITPEDFHATSSFPKDWRIGGILPPHELPDNSFFICFRTAKVGGEDVYANFLRPWALAKTTAGLLKPTRLYLDVGSREVGIVCADKDGLPLPIAEKVPHSGEDAEILAIIRQAIASHPAE